VHNDPSLEEKKFCGCMWINKVILMYI
jgi:hypothetical protein